MTAFSACVPISPPQAVRFTSLNASRFGSCSAAQRADPSAPASARAAPAGELPGPAPRPRHLGGSPRGQSSQAWRGWNHASKERRSTQRISPARCRRCTLVRVTFPVGMDANGMVRSVRSVQAGKQHSGGPWGAWMVRHSRRPATCRRCEQPQRHTTALQARCRCWWRC